MKRSVIDTHRGYRQHSPIHIDKKKERRNRPRQTMAPLPLRLGSLCFVALLHLSSALGRRGDTLEAGNVATPNLAAATCGRDNCVRLLHTAAVYPSLASSHDALSVCFSYSPPSPPLRTRSTRST